MVQELKRKEPWGKLFFTKTWVDSQIHVGKLASGGYCHIGGPPIKNQQELEAAIPAGKDLDEALDWWENKDKVQPEMERKKIIIQPDGSYTFEDGSLITRASDLIAAIAPGAALDAAILWLAEYSSAQSEIKQEQTVETAEKTAELAEKSKEIREEKALESTNRRCEFILDSGERCRRWAIKGSKFCAIENHQSKEEAEGKE